MHVGLQVRPIVFSWIYAQEAEHRLILLFVTCGSIVPECLLQYGFVYIYI